MGDTAYARCGDLSLAYQVFGEGDIDFVVAGSFVSHIELFWTLPEFKAFYDRLGEFCRVLAFDKAGVGLSDPVAKVRSLDERAMELEAVMDAAGFERPVMMGISEGGPASVVFAATRPDRTRALILTGTFPYAGGISWDRLEDDPQAIHDEIAAGLGPTYTPSAQQLALVQTLGRNVRDNWGSGEALRGLLPSVKSLRQLGMLERMSASPGMARATVESALRMDVRPILPTITVPTLVIHAREDPIPIQLGRYFADHIPGAKMVEVDGADHAPWFNDPDTITTAIEEFVTGGHASAAMSHRVLRTVLFTDIVASTERAVAMGDDRWRALLERFGAVTTELIARYGGTVVKNTGDGYLATFDAPTQAIRCAAALRQDAETLDVELRAGIHTGECERIGDDIGGIAVHIASRICGEAGAGEVLVSSAVRDLVVGSGTGFTERGTATLKGVPGEWHLLSVNVAGAAAGSPEAELVSLPTPSPRATMRRSDRAVEAVARRTPWLLRGMARLAPATGRN